MTVGDVKINEEVYPLEPKEDEMGNTQPEIPILTRENVRDITQKSLLSKIQLPQNTKLRVNKDFQLLFEPINPRKPYTARSFDLTIMDQLLARSEVELNNDIERVKKDLLTVKRTVEDFRHNSRKLVSEYALDFVRTAELEDVEDDVNRLWKNVQDLQAAKPLHRARTTALEAHMDTVKARVKELEFKTTYRVDYENDFNGLEERLKKIETDMGVAIVNNGSSSSLKKMVEKLQSAFETRAKVQYKAVDEICQRIEVIEKSAFNGKLVREKLDDVRRAIAKDNTKLQKEITLKYTEDRHELVAMFRDLEKKVVSTEKIEKDCSFTAPATQAQAGDVLMFNGENWECQAPKAVQPEPKVPLLPRVLLGLALFSPVMAATPVMGVLARLFVSATLPSKAHLLPGFRAVVKRAARFCYKADMGWRHLVALLPSSTPWLAAAELSGFTNFVSWI